MAQNHHAIRCEKGSRNAGGLQFLIISSKFVATLKAPYYKNPKKMGVM